MNLEIEGKKALVTGGSRGIGFAIAKRLAAEGCEVRLVARDAAALEAARARILAAGRAGVTVPVTIPVTIHAADLGDPAQLESVFPLSRVAVRGGTCSVRRTGERKRLRRFRLSRLCRAWRCGTGFAISVAAPSRSMGGRE